MKKVMTVLVMVLMMAGIANAANQITLTWTNPDFVACGSDPNKSGINLYKSTDDGVTKQLAGTVNSTLNVFSYTETTSAKYCYYAMAFNQIGESPYSEPACAYVSNEAPPAPTGLDAAVKWLQEISETLKAMLGKMG